MLWVSLQAIECLFRACWDRPDGLGALVLTPTRELAMQIFEELRRIGRSHSLSAGLLIGGKNVKAERDVVNGISHPPLLYRICSNLAVCRHVGRALAALQNMPLAQELLG